MTHIVCVYAHARQAWKHKCTSSCCPCSHMQAPQQQSGRLVCCIVFVACYKCTFFSFNACLFRTTFFSNELLDNPMFWKERARQVQIYSAVQLSTWNTRGVFTGIADKVAHAMCSTVLTDHFLSVKAAMEHMTVVGLVAQAGHDCPKSYPDPRPLHRCLKDLVGEGFKDEGFEDSIAYHDAVFMFNVSHRFDLWNSGK